jgi:uncharacterized protein (TIGR03437 family)
MSRIHFTRIPLAVLALAISAGAAHAASLVANPATLTLTCDTVLGPNPVTVGITLAAGATTGNVTVTATAGTAATNAVVLPSPAVLSVSSTTVATNFTFNMAAGCKGVTAATALTLTFTLAGGTTPLTVATTMGTITTTSGSALAPSPSSVLVLCTKSGSTYTAGASQTVNVTSPAYLGTPFTVNTIAQTVNSVVETALPAWLTVTGSGTASSTPVALTVSAVSGTTGTGCGALAVGSTTYNVHLLNAPAPDRILAVTVEVGVAATLAASPSSVALSYVKGSLSYTPATTSVSATPAVFFSVDPSTLPLWLNATPTTGTTTSPVTMSFVPTAGAETLPLGSYSANVHLKVSGQLDTVVPVTLQVKYPTATLTVAEGITRNISWVVGQALPSLVITPISSDSPIAYTISTAANTLSPVVTATSGIAYSFGSAPIPVTFLQSVFGAAAPGTTLSGTVTFTPASGTPVVVTINVQVKSPGALLYSISPAALPTATSGSFTVALTGSGFVFSGGSTLVTKAGIVSGGNIVSDFFVTPTVINSTTISLAITVPSSNDPYLPFAGSGGTVVFGVCNPGGGNCSTPVSTVSLSIGVNPIVQAVTSASSYMQATAPALTPVSAYDILSVFGTNFCVSGGTGCLAPNPILYGITDPVTSRYLASLSPDAAGSTQRTLSVTFQTHASSPLVIATAPLLFATNNQINLVIPSAVSAYIGSTVDIVVSFGYGSLPATMFKSSPFSVTIAATDPGVFTVGGDGQGDAAALMPNYSLITSTNVAGARLTSNEGDIISLYVTGLGAPDSTTSTAAWTTPNTVDCMTASAYWAAVNSTDSPSAPLTSNDGLVIQSALFPASNIQPCLMHSGTDVPTVKIGNIPATVVFAGWVSGSIAGLYQINVQIPAKGSAFIDSANDASQPASLAVLKLPVVVTANSVSSQPTGVNIYVAASLLVTQTGATTSAQTGALATWGSAGGDSVSGFTTAEGTGPYAYTLNTADTASLLAIGLSINATTGAITGTAVDGTATITVNVADTITPFLTGSVVVTYTIAN